METVDDAQRARQRVEAAAEFDRDARQVAGCKRINDFHTRHEIGKWSPPLFCEIALANERHRASARTERCSELDSPGAAINSSCLS